MARQGGLGPLGKQAVQRAVQEAGRRHPPRETPADVSDPTEVPEPLAQGNPAAITQATDERDTVPDNWWTPTRGSTGDSSTRIATAGYDPGSQRLYVLFHKPFPEGTPWTYDGVTQREWNNLKRSASPGKFVNRVLNTKSYHRGLWGD